MENVPGSNKGSEGKLGGKSKTAQVGRASGKNSESMAVTLLPALMYFAEQWLGGDVPETVIYSLLVFGGIVASRIARWIDSFVD